MSEDVLIVMMKNAGLGKVKTRLAKTIGEENALELYKLLIERTKKIVCDIETNLHVYYSEEIEESDKWLTNSCNKFVQKGNGLGERMKNAATKAFEIGYKNVVIIGTDCPKLTKIQIEEAFEFMLTDQVVLGPAEDGGYYLLGIQKKHIPVLSLDKWGTNDVLLKTIQLAIENKFNYCLLNELTDVDTFEDLKKHPDILKELSITNQAT